VKDLVEEAFGALVLGLLEEVLGGADLDYPALLDDEHRVGDAAHEAISWVTVTIVIPPFTRSALA